MSYNTKNYTEQGGEVTHIGGKLKFDNGAVVEGLPSAALPTATANAKGGVKIGAGINVETDGTISVVAHNPTFFFRTTNPQGTIEREFELGMTWQQFIDSAYNTGSAPSNFSVHDGFVSFMDGVYYPQNPVAENAKIIPSQKIMPLVYQQYTSGE